MTITVALTREPPRNDPLRAAIGSRARVLDVPLTSTVYVEDAVVDAAVAAVTNARWLVVTSPRAAGAAARALTVRPALGVVAVGAVTAAAITAVAPARARVLTPVVPGAVGAADLVDVGPVVSLGAATTRPELANALAARDIALTSVACYRTEPLALSGFAREELSLADVVLIAAPSAWTAASPAVRRAAVVVVTGETTRAVVAADHDHVVAAVRGHLVDALLAAIATCDGPGGSRGGR